MPSAPSRSSSPCFSPCFSPLPWGCHSRTAASGELRRFRRPAQRNHCNSNRDHERISGPPPVDSVQKELSPLGLGKPLLSKPTAHILAALPGAGRRFLPNRRCSVRKNCIAALSV